MPRPRKENQKHIRFSIHTNTIIRKYQRTRNLKTFTAALEQIIEENERLHMYIEYLGSIREIGKEPECKRRLFFNGEWYCITKATPTSGPKEKKLLTLDMCQICKAILWKLPEKAKTEQPVPTVPTTTTKKRWMPGMDIYCAWGGCYVYPSACKTCTHPCDLKPKE